MAAGADETGAANRAAGPGDGDHYEGPATLAIGGSRFTVQVQLRGHFRADRRPLPLVRTHRRARCAHRGTDIRANAGPSSPRRKVPPPASCQTPIPGSATA